MKKIAALTFLLICITPNVSFATTGNYYTPADTCAGITETSSECNTTAGCYWDTTERACLPCPGGTYNDGTITNSQCNQCTNLEDYNANADASGYGSQTGATANEYCAWYLFCNYGYTWDTSEYKCVKCDNGYTDSQAEFEFDAINNYGLFNPTCKTCGTNARVNNNGDNCNCEKDYKKAGSEPGTPITENVGTADCEPYEANDYPVYEFELFLNRPWVDNDTAYKYIYMRSGSDPKVVISETQYTGDLKTWFKAQNGLTTAPEIIYATNESASADSARYVIQRYLRTNTDAPTLNECSESEYEGIGLTPGYAPHSLDIPVNDEKIYLCWTYKSYNVEYYINKTDAAATYKIESITYDPPHETLSDDNDVFNNVNWNNDGYLASGWQCTENCDSASYNFGDEVTPAYSALNNSTVKLRANHTPCPKGSYCTNNTKYSCPAGATTETAGKSAITACYINKDSKFKAESATDPFTLDISDNLYYQDN